MAAKPGGEARGFTLFTPGPVDVWPVAREALGLPLMHHRSESFEGLWRDLGRNLAAAFLTRNRVVTLAASATGAMEAVVANLFAPGDRVLVPAGGKFARRWVEIAEAYGLEVTRLDLAPGDSPEPDLIAGALGRVDGTSGVLLTQCETSTGSLTDLCGVAGAVREAAARSGRPIILVSDSTTSWLVDELRMDAWDLDAVVAASQKGLRSPPGLAFVALGPRARARCETSRSPRYYFDLRKYLASEPTPFTPAVGLVQAAAQALERLLRLGLEKVWRANAASALALRLVVEAAGFELVAKTPSSGVVVFRTGDLEAEALALALARDHGIIVARGQDELKGSVLRVSGIGKSRREMLFFAGAFEASLAKLGRPAAAGLPPGRLEAVLEDTRIWE